MNITDNITSIQNGKVSLKTKVGKILKSGFKKKPTTEEIIQDLEKNHNHSWFTEVFNRNKNNLGDIALLYRGTEITYGELFEKIKEYAKSLKQMGIGLNSEIPVCLSNSPEIVYLMGAASMIGAKLNIFGAHFPEEYITEIINGCNSDVMFVEDNNYRVIRNAIKNSKVKKVVMNSLSDSLKNGYNPYRHMEKDPELFDSKVSTYSAEDDIVVSQKDFIDSGKEYAGELYENVDMDHDFIITYTSGSTNEDRPKALTHASRNFIYVARYHDKDYNGINTKPFTTLAHIPTFSNTNLVSCISDSLMQGAKVGLEPIYGKDTFINSILIYQPHYVAATKSFWIDAAKKILFDKNYCDVQFKNLLLCFSCGESFEINEEKIINKALKKAKTGTAFTHTPFSIIKMSEAGGDCEHGSIFYTLFRSLQNKLPKNISKGEAAGLTYFPFVEVAVLNDDGTVLGPNCPGRIVANSPCTMKGYKNNEEANKKFFIKDSTGKVWADMSLYGYMDEDKKVHIGGRIVEDAIVHPSVLRKLILKDTKNIMSCEVINIDGTYIAHIELYPDARMGAARVAFGANERCKKIVEELGIELYFRVRTNEESYPLTKSGKRNVKKIKAEGLSEKCFKPIYENGEYKEEFFTDKKVLEKIK